MILFYDFCEMWAKSKKTDASVRESLQYMIGEIKLHFPNKLLKEYTPEAIRKSLAQYSKGERMRVTSTLSLIWEQAKKIGYIKRNPMTPNLKTDKQMIKELRAHIQTQYSKIIEKLQNKHITTNDIEIYIESAPDYYQVIKQYRSTIYEDKKRQRYEEIVYDRHLPPEKLIKTTEEKLALLKEERTMVAQGYAFSQPQAVQKLETLKLLDEKIEQTQRTLASLGSLIIALTPEKNPRGRPRKDGTPPKTQKDKERKNE